MARSFVRGGKDGPRETRMSSRKRRKKKEHSCHDARQIRLVADMYPPTSMVAEWDEGDILRVNRCPNKSLPWPRLWPGLGTMIRQKHIITTTFNTVTSIQTDTAKNALAQFNIFKSPRGPPDSIIKVI